MARRPLTAVVVTLAVMGGAAASAQAAPTDLDTSFGAPNGFVLTGVGGGNVGGHGLIIDPATGDYLVGADENVSATESMGVMRFHPSGALDLGFGGEDGPFGTSFVGIDGETKTTETAVVEQTNGAIVLGGFTGTDNVFALARLTSAGHLDSTFNPGGTKPGTLTTDIPTSTSDRISALGIQSSGKIVAIGTAGSALAFARYNTNGTVDGTPLVSTFMGVDSVLPEGAVVEPGDKILVGGEASVGGVDKFMVARLTKDGSPDSTFGSGGILTFTIGSPTSRDFASAIAMQPDGKILIAGQADQDTVSDMAVARVTSGGQLDPSFGSGGVSTLSVTPQHDDAMGLALQPNGKIVLAGNAASTGETTGALAVARFDANGVPDPTFGTGGAVVHPIPGVKQSLANSVAIQSDGRIVTAGTTFATGGADVLVARLLGGEVPASPPPPSSSHDTTKPKISKLKLLTTHLRSIRRAKALKVRVHLSEAGTLTVKGTIRVKRRHHKARTITLARSRTIRFTKAATKTVRLKLARGARSRLTKPRKLKLTVSAKDLAGNKSSRSFSAKLKRR